MDEGPHPGEDHGHRGHEGRHEEAGQGPAGRPIDPDGGGSPEREEHRQRRRRDTEEAPERARHRPAAYRKLHRNSVVTPPNASVAA